MDVNLERAWRLALSAVCFDKYKGQRVITDQKVDYSKVKGPISATIAALIRAGWQPARPNLWHRDKENYINIDETKHAKSVVLRLVAQDLDRKRWDRAAAHHLGGGLERGIPSLRPAELAKKKFLQASANDRAFALDKVVCGSAWHDGREGIALPCLFCGQPDTAHHRYWSCPRLATHHDNTITSTNHYTSLITTYTWAQCLWYRGLLPAGLGTGAPLDLWDHELSTISTTNFESMAKDQQAKIGTDGSGGPSQAAHSRRVASAVAFIKFDTDGRGIQEVAVKASQCPGQQTVPRAELYAVAIAKSACNAPPVHAPPPTTATAPRTIWSDSAYTVKGSNHLDSEQLSGTNGDLWQRLHDFAPTDGTEVRKIKAHAETQVLDGHLKREHYLLNCLADATADAGAGFFADFCQIQADDYWHSVACKIATRLGILEAEVQAARPKVEWMQVPVALTPPPPPPDHTKHLASAIRSRGHRLVKLGYYARCTRCQRWRKTTNLASFMALACTNGHTTRTKATPPAAPPAAPAPERPTPGTPDPVATPEAPAQTTEELGWRYWTRAQRKRHLEQLRGTARLLRRKTNDERRQAYRT